jgi:hypothetical protein
MGGTVGGRDETEKQGTVNLEAVIQFGVKGGCKIHS